MVLEGLLAILAKDERFKIVGTASTIADFKANADAWDPDMIVADYRLPDGKGTELASTTSTPLLLISGAGGATVVHEAVRAGCAGFVSKQESSRNLANSITIVADGGSVFPAADLRTITSNSQRFDYQPLTARELDVLRLLVRARSVPEMADDLALSHHTVRNHIRSLLMKLQARSQLEAIINALRAGLVDLDD